MEFSKVVPSVRLGETGGAGGKLPGDTVKTGTTPGTRLAAKLDPKLVSAAHQFEASLMQELLKPLTSDPLTSGADQTGEGALTSSAEGSENALTSYGSEVMARGISERGGFGLANKILTHFEHRSPFKTGG